MTNTIKEMNRCVTKSRTIVEIILVLVIMFAISFVFAPIIYIIGYGFISEGNILNIITILADTTVVVGLAIYLNAKKRLPSLNIRLGGIGAIGILVSIVCTYGLVSFYEMLPYILPMEGMIESYVETMEVIFGGSPFLVFISIAIMAPLLEELIFRGLIYRNLRYYNGFWLSALISSLMWGIVHFNFLQGLQAFGLGLLFAFLYEKTYNILLPMLLHFVVNTVALFEYYYVDPEKSIFGVSESTPTLTVILITVAFLLISIVSLIYLLKKHYPNSNKINEENEVNILKVAERKIKPPVT